MAERNTPVGARRYHCPAGRLAGDPKYGSVGSLTLVGRRQPSTTAYSTSLRALSRAASADALIPDAVATCRPGASCRPSVSGIPLDCPRRCMGRNSAEGTPWAACRALTVASSVPVRSLTMMRAAGDWAAAPPGISPDSRPAHTPRWTARRRAEVKEDMQVISGGNQGAC